MPIVLIGIRTTVNDIIQAFCAELIFSTMFRLPCEIVDESIIQTMKCQAAVTFSRYIGSFPREVLYSLSDSHILVFAKS